MVVVQQGDREIHFEPALRVISGNYVTAKRRGVIEGVDFGLTGEVGPAPGPASGVGWGGVGVVCVLGGGDWAGHGSGSGMGLAGMGLCVGGGGGWEVGTRDWGLGGVPE